MEENKNNTQSSSTTFVIPIRVESKKKIITFYKKSITQESPKHKYYTPLTRSDFDNSQIQKWMEIRCGKLPKRRCHHISFTFNSYLYIYGGMDICEGRMTDLQRIKIDNFENPKWEEVTTNGVHPESLTGQSGVVVNNMLYMFGGENEYEKSTNSLYILNLTDLKWEKRIFIENDIPNLYGHTMSYYMSENKIVLFGGYSKGVFLNSIFYYYIDSNEWVKQEYLNSIEYSESKEANQIKDSTELNSTITTATTTTPNTRFHPEGRIFHSSVIINNLLYIYAGIKENNMSDMWKFNLTDKTWEMVKYTDTDRPLARSGHTSVYHELSQCIYIFGGKISNIQERNEFWKFDINTNSFILIHDTLIERHSEDLSLSQTNTVKRSGSIRKKPNTSFLLGGNAEPHESTFKLEPMNNTEEKTPIAKVVGKHSHSIHKKTNNKNNEIHKSKFEELLLSTSTSKKMKNSMIYKMDFSDSNILKQGTTTLLSLSSFSGQEVIKNGVVPNPRDGHSAVVYNNSMIVFGGDRNKFPYNDLFVFNF